MENKEYNFKLNELMKEVNKLNTEYISSKTKLKIGDCVKFTEEGDYYMGYADVKHKGIIHSFQILPNMKIQIQCKGIHYKPYLEEVKKCTSKESKEVKNNF